MDFYFIQMAQNGQAKKGTVILSAIKSKQQSILLDESITLTCYSKKEARVVSNKVVETDYLLLTNVWLIV